MAANTSISASGTGGPTLSQINFRQLQDMVNKWTLELEEQEAVFIENATKVNYWDKILTANAEKITKLNDLSEIVKCNHSKLENVLEYIKGQQTELESVLEPLETLIPKNKHFVDPERENLYALAEDIDTDLEQMNEELKDIVRHLNDNNSYSDSSDPLSVVKKILNEHIDTLHWIELSSEELKDNVDEAKGLNESYKDTHEKSMSKTLNDIYNKD